MRRKLAASSHRHKVIKQEQDERFLPAMLDGKQRKCCETSSSQPPVSIDQRPMRTSVIIRNICRSNIFVNPQPHLLCHMDEPQDYSQGSPNLLLQSALACTDSILFVEPRLKLQQSIIEFMDQKVRIYFCDFSCIFVLRHALWLK